MIRALALALALAMSPETSAEKETEGLASKTAPEVAPKTAANLAPKAPASIVTRHPKPKATPTANPKARFQASPRASLPAARVDAAAPRFVDAKTPRQTAAIVDEIARAQGDFTSRLVQASERFLGTPYRLDPLGEGPGAQDADPLLRFDAVDCMTLVETVIALAERGAPEALESRLTAIRYASETPDAAPAFESRHHFFTAQWVPAMRQRGQLRDITAEIATQANAPELAVRHVKDISRESWRKRTSGRRFDLPLSRVPLGRHELAFIPIDRVNDIAARLKSGTLFALVREDRPLSPFLVTHIGFVIQRDGKTWLRHAARDIYGQVVDEELWHYTRRAARYRKWRVLGMQFFALQEGTTAPQALWDNGRNDGAIPLSDIPGSALNIAAE